MNKVNAYVSGFSQGDFVFKLFKVSKITNFFK